MPICVIHLIWDTSVKSLMFSPPVIEVHPPLNASAGLGHGVVGVKIGFLIFETAPQALNEDVIHLAPLSIHADLYAMLLECSGEYFAGELTALVSIENVGWAILRQRLVESLDAERRVEGVGQPPGKHFRDVCDIGAPDLIGPLNRETTQ